MAAMMAAMDTLALATDLTDAGLDRVQADRIAAAIGRSFDAYVATKGDIERVVVTLGTDIAAVKADIDRVETSLKADIDRVETSLKADIAVVKMDIERVETTLKADIVQMKAEVKADIASAKWQVLLAIFAAVGLFATLGRLV